MLVGSAPEFGLGSLAAGVVVPNSKSSLVSMVLGYVRSVALFVGKSLWVEDTEVEVLPWKEERN